MGTICSSKKFAQFEFDDSDEVVEEKSKWRPANSGKKKPLFGDSSVDKYEFLESFTKGMEPRGKKVRNETVIVDEVDEAVKERIHRSDAGFQSVSSNYNLKTSSQSGFRDLCTSYSGGSINNPRSVKAATDKMDSKCTQGLHLADIDLVSIISDEDSDNLSTMSSNDLADVKGSSGKQILEHEMKLQESSVVVCPECVTYRRNCYSKAQLTFFCSSIKLVLEEEGAKGSLTFEWKIDDLISIESRWLNPSIKAEVCLRIKPEDPKLATSVQNSGILEVKFTVSDPCWSNTQECIKILDEQYNEKWDVDLDSYELFEDITYLEGDCDSISISKRDFQLLQPEKFINDTIVDFYIEYMKKIKPADANVHFFNSFFFRKLADLDENQTQSIDAKAAFQRVRKWTKKVDIFQKDYIFIPVNFRLHWSLIVICHPGEVVNFRDEELEKSLKVPCILHMDSIKGSHRGLEQRIKWYLCEEWKERISPAAEDISTKFMNLRFLHLEVPQQQNSYDCALFMLHYMELFVKQAPDNFNPLINFISNNWFHPLEASLKRTRIKRLIFELAKSNAAQKVLSPNKSSSQLKDEDQEEAEVEILLETGNSKETCISDTYVDISGKPIMGKPLRSEQPDLCSDMDINLPEKSSLLPSHNGEFLDTEENGGPVIADNEQSHGQLVLYDPSVNVCSPIKEIDETEGDINKQIVVSEGPPAGKNKIHDLLMTCIDKSLSLLQPKENSASSLGDDVQLTHVIEDSDESSESSSDNVLETCYVEDSDPDDVSSNQHASSYHKATFSNQKDVSGNCLNVESSKRRQGLICAARKRLRRG